MTDTDSLTRLLAQARAIHRRSSRLAWRKLLNDARQAKGKASAADRNTIWSVETYAGAVGLYLTAFDHLQRKRYYKGWCDLERAEIALGVIAQNEGPPAILKDAKDLAEAISRLQSLFPYKVFASPGFIYEDWACSICGLKSTPIDPCGHFVGKVYEGKLCTHRITRVKLLEVSLVRDPVQKYSVMTPEDHEHDFSMVEYLIDRMDGPFHRWHGEWSYRRHPHQRFTQHPADGPCPCETGLRYNECCLPESGVRVRHFAMQLEGDRPFEEGVLYSGVRRKVGLAP